MTGLAGWLSDMAQRMNCREKPRWMAWRHCLASQPASQLLVGWGTYGLVTWQGVCWLGWPADCIRIYLHPLCGRAPLYSFIHLELHAITHFHKLQCRYSANSWAAIHPASDRAQLIHQLSNTGLLSRIDDNALFVWAARRRCGREGGKEALAKCLLIIRQQSGYSYPTTIKLQAILHSDTSSASHLLKARPSIQIGRSQWANDESQCLTAARGTFVVKHGKIS